ncbi:response regulator [Aquiflexum sp.]|uniref:response regulator n=1 Tax=Aquiflexum sp. TaxID=1872584 RepID=UPI0035948E85
MPNYFEWQKIILIDDDSILNLIHKKVLKIIGFHETVLDFNNGFQAIEYIYREIEQSSSTNMDISLIILDLEMPILNGWGFLDRFLILEPQVREKFKIIVSSSSKNPEDIKRALEYEVVSEYIPKPITIDIFGRIIWDGIEKDKDKGSGREEDFRF